jgi:hypothetical protein
MRGGLVVKYRDRHGVVHDACDLGGNRITVCEREHGERFLNDALHPLLEEVATTCLQCLVAPARFRSMPGS